MPADPFSHSITLLHYLMLSYQSVTQSEPQLPCRRHHKRDVSETLPNYFQVFALIRLLLRVLLQSLDKAHESFSSLFGTFIDTCVFEYMNKYFSDLLL